MVGLVSVDYGISIMPKISSLAHYNVKVLSINEPKHDRFIYLASLKNHYISPASKAFKDFALRYGKSISYKKGANQIGGSFSIKNKYFLLQHPH